MKKPFILVLALLAFSAGGLSPAQEKKSMDKPTPKLFIGRVTQADEKAKTVTLLAKDGEKVTLNLSNPKLGTCKGGRKLSALPAVPKVGDVLAARVNQCDDCLATC